MSIQISGHNIEVTPTLNELIQKKFAALGKHSEQIISTHVVLAVDKTSQKAEATIHIPKNKIFAKATSKDMYKTIDLLLEKVVRQLEKHKGKNNNH